MAETACVFPWEPRLVRRSVIEWGSFFTGDEGSAKALPVGTEPLVYRSDPVGPGAVSVLRGEVWSKIYTLKMSGALTEPQSFSEVCKPNDDTKVRAVCRKKEPY